MELLLQANQMRWRTPFPSMPMAACDCVCAHWGGGLFSRAWRPLLSPTDLWGGPNEQRVVVSLSASDRPHSGHSCAGPRCCFPTACWAAALLRGRRSHLLPPFSSFYPLSVSLPLQPSLALSLFMTLKPNYYYLLILSNMVLETLLSIICICHVWRPVTRVGKWQLWLRWQPPALTPGWATGLWPLGSR